MRRVGRALRRSLVLAIALGVGVVLVVGFTLRLFVWPATDPVEPADAVVVLAGGDGERLDRAKELMRDGVAPTLALSFGPVGMCTSPQPFDLVCFTPDPETTRGEAEAIGRLAQERHWSNVIVVTSTPHVTRSRLLVERCYSGRLQVTGAAPDAGLPTWLGAIVHEWGGLAESLVRRSC
jgi:uncharacterized SAM-binding protein YcdF (DUF218 family)